MSGLGLKIDLAKADYLAGLAIKHLRPSVRRIAIAGSVRRRKPRVGDIELLCEPEMQGDLLDGEIPLTDAVKHGLWQIGTWVRGASRQMIITDLFDNPGVRLDVYLVWPPSQWGVQMLIRTGPRDFSQRAVTRLRSFGTPSENGRILDLKTGKTIDTPEEEDVFRLLKCPPIPPEKRR